MEPSALGERQTNMRPIWPVIALLTIAATLESVFALCLGCIAYRFLWECDDCADISERLRLATASNDLVTNRRSAPAAVRSGRART